MWGNYSWKRAWQECGYRTKTVNPRNNFPLKENQKVPNPSSFCYKSDRPWLYHGRCATFHCAASAHRRRAAASLHPNARWRCCQHDREMFYARNICRLRPVGVVWYYMNCTAASLPSAAFVTCPAFAMAKDPFPRGFFRKLLYIQVSFREISLHSESNRQSGLVSLYHPMLCGWCDWVLPVLINRLTFMLYSDWWKFLGIAVSSHWIIKSNILLIPVAVATTSMLHLALAASRSCIWGRKSLSPNYIYELLFPSFHFLWHVADVRITCLCYFKLCSFGHLHLGRCRRTLCKGWPWVKVGEIHGHWS